MAQLRAVTEPDDPLLEPFRLVRDRDLAGRHDLLIAEGEVVVRRLLSARSRFRAELLLVSPERLKALAPVLAEAPDVTVLVAPAPVMNATVGFPLHRGILATAGRGVPANPSRILPPAGRPALVLGLVGLANHDNVGAAFRNAAAFGADAVLLDEGCCDPLYRKAIRVSVGAALSVPFARAGTADELVGRLAAAGIEPVALSPAGRERVSAMRWPDRCALLVGPEGAGLPPALLARCRTARIEMPGGFDSLNVATAAAIALHAAAVRAEH